MAKKRRFQALGHNVLNVLTKESLRWRHISLSSYACHLVPLQRVVDKIPALTSITINLFPDTSAVIPGFVDTFLRTAPLLKSVHFEGFPSDMPIPGLCYHQLIEFIDIWYTLTDTVYINTW